MVKGEGEGEGEVEGVEEAELGLEEVEELLTEEFMEEVEVKLEFREEEESSENVAPLLQP